ncbi:protein kinase domain protein [Ichthyophthirius multifiliis]|uniref:non-specific serine/threonine protein kinase n=1 Tax=Ichthyophthirius multifiliis TaxID=5932 RepID=G0QM88_ICHMU|nr:protein kinase domain protein [Ichthyophthirius multifiliis]EGR33665.1 protein kinase domain protein [Ichthyophthirius multifiliis]|eukprot:XP_004037651.1 protein kinase domain protein [Ichthyophthirius multifiliis]
MANFKETQETSGIAIQKAEAAKSYIEKKYSKIKILEKERKDNWEAIKTKISELNLSSQQSQQIINKIKQQEAQNMRLMRKKITANDFEPLSIIGKGAFGEVRICKCKHTQEIVAIKKMKKSEMIYKNQVSHVIAERDVLALANNISWIVELKNSFQDQKYLYLVMEFLQGGDLMTLLIERSILSEIEVRFYAAEIVLAIESVHKMNYIHRDIKPDNILLTKNGHIKLSDFGLCKQTNRKRLFSTVGTPDYIAPEVFGQEGYTESVDWWSVGIIIYEMLIGYPPFNSENPNSTCKKIVQWRKYFQFPNEPQISTVAKDLIKKLIIENEKRIGVNEIKNILFLMEQIGRIFNFKMLLLFQKQKVKQMIVDLKNMKKKNLGIMNIKIINSVLKTEIQIKILLAILIKGKKENFWFKPYKNLTMYKYK